MTGLEIVLYVYLAGWIGTSSVQAFKCDDSRVITKNECRVIAVFGGAMWPVIAVQDSE